MSEKMKVVTWLSLESDPRKGMRNGRCAFTGEFPGVFVVPLGPVDPLEGRSINTFWFEPERGREVQVILEVPIENLVRRCSGIERPLHLPSGRIQSIPVLINWCFDDDNALVVKNLNPDWIVSVRAFRVLNGFIVEDEIPNNLWD